MGSLLCISAEVRIAIELSSSVVSGMGPGIDARDVLKGKGLFLGFFGICTPIGLNGQNDVLFAEK